jgi:hypothetical protein
MSFVWGAEENVNTLKNASKRLPNITFLKGWNILRIKRK